MRGLALALALWAGSAGAGGAETVRIAAEPSFPPFVMLDDAGTLTGFDKAVGDEICARAALTCEWVMTGFDDLLPGVAEGRFDLAMSGLGNSDARREIVDFTEIYLPSINPAAYVGKPGAPVPSEARLGVHAGTIHEDYLADLGVSYTPFDSAEAALRAVDRGEIDLVLGSSSYFSAVLPTGFPALRMLGPADTGVDGTAIAVAKDQDALRDKIDQVILDMRDDGTIAGLVEIWFAPQSDL